MESLQHKSGHNEPSKKGQENASVTSVSCSANTELRHSERIWREYPDARYVVEARQNGAGKVLTLEDARGERSTEHVSRFTYIHFKPERGECASLDSRDFFLRDEEEGGGLLKICEDGTALATARVRPYYCRQHLVNVCDGFSLSLECREVTTDQDYEAVTWLNRFHYRNLNLWGRSACLILSLNGPTENLPTVDSIGYIILNSPPLLTRPRDILLGWDKEGRKDNVDRVLRIARVVVHPEFRGLGLGRLLVESAIEYAAQYWNAMGKKPWLIETVAEMSKYHPVFEKAGMFHFGCTAGRDEVFVTPTSSLDHTMGPGHWRSSLDRMRMNKSTPKPYFAALLDSCPPDIRELVGNKVKEDNGATQCVRLPERQKFSPPSIRFERVTLKYGGPHSGNGFMERGNGGWTTVGEDSSSVLSPSEVLVLINKLASETHHLVSEEPLPTSKQQDGYEWPQAVLDTYNAFIGEVSDLGHRLTSVAQVVESRIAEMEQMNQEVLENLRSVVANREAVAKRALGLIEALDTSIEQVLSCECRNNALWAQLSNLRSHILAFSKDLQLCPASVREKEIISAFGLCPEKQDEMVLEDFSLDILPGQVVLLVGGSGSGKTSLLKSILGAPLISAGRLNTNEIAEAVGTLDLDFPPNVPVIDLIGRDTAEACRILNAAGISEAKLYLKRRDELSHGQRYRVAAAILAASGKSIWLADEFCAFLDPLTATIVSSGLAKLARDFGATFIAAVADGTRVSAGLQPDLILRLVYGGRPEPDPRIHFWKSVEGWRDFVSQATTDSLDSASAKDELIRATDLIYHRIGSEYLLCECRDNKTIMEALLASLSGLVPEWTPATLKRQINLRVRLWKTLNSIPSRTCKDEEPL